ncbi:glycosyltransferase family 4 protein [Halopenitus persicus]|uniref:Glycosyltransferase involved in cell wall bisynthesis n=1 Tax=Halopenitus persicus TaxID=1048396 RepID=A0A1H3MM57_9EURY|nr:glycosyltransferase family 4 protein [Halopenitus persicus]SDY77727.1 Glycosyltransferase involved in cell wall bisynthesis [Halopenitus persicus]
MSDTLAFVTHQCPHYRTGFFERFEERLTLDSKVFFTDHKQGWRAYGDFEYEVLPHWAPREHYEFAPTVLYRLWQYAPDVVVSGPVEQFAAHASYLYAKATGTPFVLWTGEWTVPKTTLRTVTFPLIRRIYQGADSIAVYGPHIRDYVTDLGIDRGKIHLAWNTTDIEYFRKPCAEDAEELRDQLDVPEDVPVALYVGRHVKEKGLEYLIDAFREIVDEVEPTPYLLLVGDGDRRKELEKRADDLDTVLFPGYVENEDLPPYYGLADVFVLPSVQTEIFREPWGLVVTEAMASGTPVVTSSQVGIAAAGVVKDGENGYIVPERNPHVLGDRLERLLTDEELRTEMGDAAADVISEYDYDRMVDGFISAIEDALGTQNVDS